MTISADTKNRLRFALTSQAAADEVSTALDGITSLPSASIIVGNAAGVATDVAMTGDVNIDNAGITTIAAQKIDGTNVKSVANANIVGGIELVIRVDIADASADTDVIMTHKVRVKSFAFLNTGIGAHASLDTVQLKNGATAITDAVAKTATVNKLVAANTYDPAQVEIAAAGTLRITAAKNTNVAGTAYITVFRVA